MMCKNRKLWLRLRPQVLLPLGEPDHGPGTWPEDTMLGLEHITYTDHFSIEPHIHILFFDVFGELLADGTPHGPFPCSSHPVGSQMVQSSRSLVGTRYQVASNHERLEVRCERVEQKTRCDSEVTCGMMGDGYPLVI